MTQAILPARRAHPPGELRTAPGNRPQTRWDRFRSDPIFHWPFPIPPSAVAAQPVGGQAGVCADPRFESGSGRCGVRNCPLVRWAGRPGVGEVVAPPRLNREEPGWRSRRLGQSDTRKLPMVALTPAVPPAQLPTPRPDPDHPYLPFCQLQGLTPMALTPMARRPTGVGDPNGPPVGTASALSSVDHSKRLSVQGT